MAAHHHTEACRMLGVSAGTLRRLAKGYAASFTELPTDGAGGRIYLDDALNTMQEARELVKSRRVGTLEKAFELLADGSVDIVPLPETGASDGLLGELQGIRHALERVVADNEILRSEVQALCEQVHALPAPHENGKAKYVCLLERRNTYLEEELRRRDEQPAPRRAWWKVWG